MTIAAVEKKTFNDLYLREYDRSVSIDDHELRNLVHHDFGEPSGNVLRTLDKYGRRVLILVGDGHNIIVHDRYPSLPGRNFLIKAIQQVHNLLPPVVTDKDIPQLMELMFFDQ